MASVQRPTDDDIKAREEADINTMQATNASESSQAIKKANPELTKVLNEEPSSNVPKDNG